MRILYFDCFNGASGDMVLGALLDAGLPLAALREALGSLAIDDFEVTASKVLRAGVSATKFDLVEHGAPTAVERAPAAAHSHAHHHGHDHGHATSPTSPTPPTVPTHHAHRSLPEIFTHIDRSALSEAGRSRAKALFQRLAEAEAAIHQMPVERVHLHEVGALDSIIDIVGAVFALDWFKADRIICSPINVGSGMVHSAHGVFPVPAPATVRLLGDAPIFSRGPEAELLTPLRSVRCRR
jgi:pyridinium-3,5-bisthiocarboxylic acid mononucleotide nickel chelatase